MTEEFVTGVDPGKVFSYGEINQTLSSRVNPEVFGYEEFNLSRCQPHCGYITTTGVDILPFQLLAWIQPWGSIMISPLCEGMKCGTTGHECSVS